MSFEGISFTKLAIIFIIAGVVIVFAIMGSSATNLLFSDSITEEAEVKMKQGGNCVVEPSDTIPRTIANCLYNVNDTLIITYKLQQPSIENHEPV